MMFMITPIGGVHRVPAAWIDALLPSGFRQATAEEIAFWYEERGLEPPAGETAASAAAAAAPAAGSTGGVVASLAAFARALPSTATSSHQVGRQE